jgi:hypothetical protein
MMMPDDNHLSLAGFSPAAAGRCRALDRFNAVHPARRIALVLMDGRLQKPVSEVAGWP